MLDSDYFPLSLLPLHRLNRVNPERLLHGLVAKLYVRLFCLPNCVTAGQIRQIFCCWVAKSCVTLCDLVDCSAPGFPVLDAFFTIPAHCKHGKWYEKKGSVQVNQTVTAAWNATFYMKSHSERETNLPKMIYSVSFTPVKCHFLKKTLPNHLQATMISHFWIPVVVKWHFVHALLYTSAIAFSEFGHDKYLIV